MQIYGREVKFLRTVAGNCKIADICPDGDINKAGMLFEGSYQKSQVTAAKFICIMAEGYELNRKFNDPSYEPFILTQEMIMNLPDEDFGKAFDEALKSYAGEKATVEAEPVKTKKKAVPKSA
ncbi:MAG: hypothetical protein IJT16_08010 [Lachnospiraceae bacterium]|nr:hypothetical protein [Lachnospiraceae bacterium]